ncbi:helix-turn-helix transcriptional regulator [soil metagenome]
MSEISHVTAAPSATQLRSGGDVYTRHRHDDHQLVYVSSGVLATHTAKGAWVAWPDRAVWIPGGLWHEHRLYGASVVHTVGFPLAETPLPVDVPRVVAVSALLRELVIEFTRDSASSEDGALLRRLIVNRLTIAPVQGLSLPETDEPRLALACSLASEDLSDPIPLNKLAAAVGAGERTLSRLYRTEFGMSYPQWRTNVRIFHAMIDLAEGCTVTQTAHRNGWPTASAFIDTFSRVMGCTPGQYRSASS